MRFWITRLGKEKEQRPVKPYKSFHFSPDLFLIPRPFFYHFYPHWVLTVQVENRQGKAPPSTILWFTEQVTPGCETCSDLLCLSHQGLTTSIQWEFTEHRPAAPIQAERTLTQDWWIYAMCAWACVCAYVWACVNMCVCVQGGGPW